MLAGTITPPGQRQSPLEGDGNRVHAVRAVIVTLAAVAVLVVPAIGDAVEGPLITAARVEAVGPVDADEILEVLGLRPGDRLDRQRLRELILTLYAGGEVEWLRVETQRSDGGVEVLVRLSFRSKITKVTVRAGSPTLRVKVRRWVQLGYGDPVTAAKIEASRRRVERRLHDRGYADAVVDAYINFRRSTNTVEVEFDVDRGPPQVVASVVVEGVGNDELAAEARPKFKPGTKLTARLEDRLRTRTETNLRSAGYWEAEVLSIERRVDGANVELAMQAETGPHFRLEIEAPPEALDIAERAFPDPAQQEVHPAQTDALAEQVVETLQESGFLLAHVRADLVPGADEQILRLQVEPGRKLKIADVEFPGAQSLGESRLRDTVAVQEGGTGGRFGQTVTNATLEADRKALLELYQREGFPYAVLDPPQLVRVDDADAVKVLFPINEGVRWFISEVRIEGLPVEAAAVLESRPLELVDGSPWSPGAVERARRRLDEALADSGYPEGRVDAHVDTSTEGSASVALQVDSGPFVRVGEVIIAGLRHTHLNLVSGVVRRAGVRTGEPLSRKKLLDAQRGLFELGLFRRVELAPMPGQEHRTDRNIVVRCEEGEQKSYLFGVGYSNVDAARLILGWSHLNLLGRAYAFSAEVSLANSQQRYSLSLRKRRTFGLPIPGYLAIYRTDEVLADRNLVRRGLWIDFGDRLKRPFRPWFRYEYDITQPENLPIGVPQTVDPSFEESKVASVTPSLEWDTRDNPLAPTTGVFASASLQYAFPAFQADEHFIKLYTGATVYRPMLRGFTAAGLRLGAIEPINPVEGVPKNLQIPFAYRFFAGGRTTQRAFDTDSLGIPGQTILDGDAVGGNAVILLNLEDRRRIAGQFFAAVFVDAGNVWATPADVNLGDIEWGPGLGLQYVTPAGPLRAEYGWRINPGPGEPGGKFFISFGVPF
jgi:outer membrane protein assembly complex protein YaeT